MSEVDYEHRSPFSEPLKAKKKLTRRQFLTHTAAAAAGAVAGAVGGFFAGSSRPTSNEAPPTPTPAARPTEIVKAAPTAIEKPRQVQLFVGPDYATRISPEARSRLTPSEGWFLKVEKAVVEILPPLPSLTHPRAADEKGTDPYYLESRWQAGEYPSRLGTPAENVIKNQNWDNGPIRLYGTVSLNLFYGPGQLLPSPLILYIPEAILAPYLENINGLNAYVDDANLDSQRRSSPKFPLRPLDPIAEGPRIDRINIKTLGQLNESIVRGSPLVPGPYHLISWLSHTRIEEDTPQEIPVPIPKAIRLIFWDKGTDPAIQNLKRLAIEL